MTDILASRTPYLDAVLHALIDPERTDFEIRHLDLGRARSVWLAEVRREIAGLSARDVTEVSVPVLTRHFAVIVCPKASGCDLEGVETDVYLAADVEVALASLTPTDAPKGARGRLLLNAYGRTCYDAGRAACADQPWQPIASAPKAPDDVIALGAYDKYGSWLVEACSWCPDPSDGEPCWLAWDYNMPPTHWMPLPAPPSPAASIKE